MLPLLALHVTAVHGVVDVNPRLSQTPLIEAFGGTPITFTLTGNGKVSLLPIVNVEGAKLTLTPESSVTVAVADALVPLAELAACTVTVIVVFAGTRAGAW